jgi:hypothetical protein
VKWLIGIVAALAAVVVTVYAIGWSLPVEHVAWSERVIAAPLAQVARRIRDVGDYGAWRPVKVEILSTENGRTRYRETSGDDTITFDLVEEAGGQRFTSTILDEDLPFDGSWTITLASEVEGTRVRIAEHGRVKDPLFRFLSSFVVGHTSTMEAYLDALAVASAETRSAFLKSGPTRSIRFVQTPPPKSLGSRSTSSGVSTPLVPGSPDA